MSFRVLGVGEVLWDLLPAGAQLGGAPANFACHARALGADAGIVTRVGDDALGRDILRRFEVLGLPASLVQVDESAPTGTVAVELDAGRSAALHDPRERRVGPPAGDARGARRRRRAADAVCFGSLAQRGEPARRSIQAPGGGHPRRRSPDLRRQPAASRSTRARSLEQSLRLANVLKLNDGELPVLASRCSASAARADAQLDALARRFDLRAGGADARRAGAACSAAPPAGSITPASRRRSWTPSARATPSRPRSRSGLLLGWPLDRTNALANEVACHVCGCAGATPPLPPRLAAVFASASPDPSGDR